MSATSPDIRERGEAAGTNVAEEHPAPRDREPRAGPARAALDEVDAPPRRRREPPPAEPRAPSLAQLAWPLLEYRWMVLGVVLVAVGLASAWLLTATPTYESRVAVQVEGRTRTVPGFRDVSPLFEAEPPVEAETRLLRSGPLLQSVVDELRLDVEVRPRSFPLLGRALARIRKAPGLAPAPFGPARYAWGGERISVASLQVSPDLIDEPLTLTALGGDRYQLAAPGLGVVLEGEVGKSAASAPGTGHAELLVTELVARSGTEFIARKHRATAVVAQLQEDLKVADQGRPSGVVELSLTGSDPGRVAAILNAIARTYVHQTEDRTSAEATRTLRFLETQLPALKTNVERAETAMNAFRRTSGVVNLSFEGQSLVTQGSDMDLKIADLQVEAAELHKRYSETHPAVVAAEEKLRSLRAQRAALDQRMRTLPVLELQSAQLTRSVQLATELYLNVQLRAQELRIVNAGLMDSVRVLDPAVEATRPARPNPWLTLALGLLLGIGAGVWAAYLRSGLQDSLEDPDEIEAGTGLPVLGAVPRTRAQRALDRRGRHRPVAPLAIAAPGDRAVEDLRALRTSVQFALRDAKNNVISVSGPAPRVGKSFISVNLAHLLAGAGLRVVLVDADLRRGELHRHFGAEPHPGLAEVLLGSATLDAAVRATEVPRLSFLPTGTLPPDPAELAATPRTGAILEELSRRYDVVLVDTPPVLSVTDSALIGRHAGVNLLVVRSRQHTAQEIAFTLRRLAQNGVTISGAVLNDVRPARGRYGRHGAYRLYSTSSVRVS